MSRLLILVSLVSFYLPFLLLIFLFILSFVSLSTRQFPFRPLSHHSPIPFTFQLVPFFFFIFVDTRRILHFLASHSYCLPPIFLFAFSFIFLFGRLLILHFSYLLSPKSHLKPVFVFILLSPTFVSCSPNFQVLFPPYFHLFFFNTLYFPIILLNSQSQVHTTVNSLSTSSSSATSSSVTLAFLPSWRGGRKEGNTTRPPGNTTK